jgi:hypothetical protein
MSPFKAAAHGSMVAAFFIADGACQLFGEKERANAAA